MATAQLKDKITLTKEQKEVLYGAFLGDGCLYLNRNGKNAQFTYQSKSRQHVEYVGNFFKQYWSGEGIKDGSYFDKRTQKEYYHSRVRTYTNETFTEEYYKWYIGGVKHLPSDLVLTPLMCLIWYIGDGSIHHTTRSEHIQLATNCFSKEEQEAILLPQLSKFEAHLIKRDNEQYAIYIPRRKEAEFLQYIGDCPFDDYKYKWKITPYKNKKPKNHKEHENEFCEMYKQGMTYYAIAKHFGIEPNAVKYYLKKHNLYKNLK